MANICISREKIEKSLLKDNAYFINEVMDNLEDDSCVSIEKDTYDLRTTYSREELCYISNNDSGVKSIAFYLKDKKNIIIDGNGSSLMGFGRILPFYITNCSNVTIRNFTIDYERPFTSQGEVIEASPSYVVMKVDKKEFPYEIRNNTLKFIGDGYVNDFIHGFLEFDKDEKRPISTAFDSTANSSVYAQELEDGVLKIYHNFRVTPKVGSILTIKHDMRIVPAITIDKCDNVKIENIWIKHCGTMGVVAQLSKDITVDRVKICPDPSSPRVFSINADATHFVNCSGTVIVENGVFEGMFDDVINVHGNYLFIEKVIDTSHVIAKIPHRQQVGFINFIEGDKAVICEQLTMMEEQHNVIKGLRKINNQYYEIEFEQPFNFEEGKNYCIDNEDRYPVVIFRNNRCGKNRARGLILTSTKDMIVENNYMDTEGSVIKVNSDMKNWFESGAMKKLYVRNNVMKRHNPGNWGTALIDIDPGMLKEVDGQPFHGDIFIEGNTIYLDKTQLLYGYSFKDAVVKNNTIYCSEECNEDNIVETRNAENITVVDNKILSNK